MTTWTNKEKYTGQAGITYNEVGKTYNNIGYNYWGLLTTVFSNLSKSVSSFTNLAKSAASTYTNQTKH